MAYKQYRNTYGPVTFYRDFYLVSRDSLPIRNDLDVWLNSNKVT